MNIEQLLNSDVLTKDDLVQLLSVRSEDERKKLYRKAFEVKRNYFANQIHLRGIIEFSNYCRQDCYYCGIRHENDNVHRYRMHMDEILNSAEMIIKSGIKTIVLQSGEDLFYDEEKISEIIIAIKNRYDVAITLSLGERNYDEYKAWFDAGADRYLLKHETANPNIYYDIHPYQDFDERVKHLKYLKSIGYQIGSGNIIGLPHQSNSNIAEDILLCQELDVDMASFSPFIPAEYTPFSNLTIGDLDLTLNTMAVARIYLKNVHIPATTALSTLNPEGRKLGLLAGANVVMPTFTPNNYRFNYLIYKNKPGSSEAPSTKMDNLLALLSQLNLEASNSQGHSVRKSNIEKEFNN